MAIAMTTGYSAQTEGALLCIEAASDWALTCVDHLAAQSSHLLIDYGAADGGTAVRRWNQVLDRLHANQPNAHLTLIGNDLPSNDNVALAENLALQIPRPPQPTRATLTVSLPAACTTFSMGIWLRAVPAATAEPEVLRNLRRLEALSDFLLIKNAIVLGY